MKNSRIGKAIKYALSLLFIYRFKSFLQNVFCVPIFYDIFARPSQRDICVIAPYYSLRGFARSACVCSVVDKKIVLKPAIVNDPEKNCLIVLFALPAIADADFTYVIKKGSKELYKGSYERKPTKERYRLSMATLFKYESDFLKEWMDYHLGKGIEHLYLYENNKVPDPKIARILLPYVTAGLVTHIMWPYPYHIYNYHFRKLWPYDAFSYAQLPQINHAIYKFGEEMEWMLACDVDEYFYSPKHVAFSALLDEAEKAGDVSSIRIPGFWFGGTSADLERVTTDGVLKSFVYAERFPTSSPKCIFNTDQVKLASVHNSVRQSGKEVNVPADTFRFNHYRGLGWKGRTDETSAREIKDTGILQ